MLLDDFARTIPDFSGWTHTQRIRFLSWFFHTHENRVRCEISDFRKAYEALHLAEPSNWSQLVTQLVAKRDLVKTSNGLMLARPVRDVFDSEYGLRRVPIAAEVERLHPAIVKASARLFSDGHYASAILDAFKAVEVRVRTMTGIEATGQALMGQAFNEKNPRIRVTSEPGLTGENEQSGFKLLFMGAMAGIRNPKAHSFIEQKDPQRALEHLAFASILMRRLDDAEVCAPTPA